jgi:hypothetical protein
MSYQGPMLIREPVLRWPIVILAALITAAIALLAAGMQYVAMTEPYANPIQSRDSKGRYNRASRSLSSFANKS